MKLIVGLGNPGKAYLHTRHNIGATMLARFLAGEQLGTMKYDAKFVAEVWKGDDVIFAFPQTFMNLSGNAVESLARFYNVVSTDMLVLHDEIELPLGKIALKVGGGAAGHNGLRNITSKLGTPNFLRLRIGVGKSETLGVAAFVLQKFKPHEEEVLCVKEEEIFSFIREFLAK